MSCDEPVCRLILVYVITEVRALAAGVGNYLAASWPCGVFVGAVLATLDWGCDR